jgi:hypothetical protein
MNVQPAPRLATWLLQLFCCKEDDAMIGDLLERYRSGHGTFWFWRQVLGITFIQGRRLLSFNHVFVVTLLAVAFATVWMSALWPLGLIAIVGGILVGSLRFANSRTNRWPLVSSGIPAAARIDSSRIPIGGGIGAGVLILFLLGAALVDLPELRTLAVPGVLAGLLLAASMVFGRKLHPRNIDKNHLSIKPR